MNYSIPYPYTITIYSLFLVSVLGVFMSRSKIYWGRYLKGLALTFICGVGQIIFLQNVGNIPAWYYPDGSALGRDWITWLLPNVCFEDMLFVPVCYTAFYYFMFRIRNVKDNKRGWLVWVVCAFVTGELIVGYLGGKIASDMILYCAIVPIIGVLIIKGFTPEMIGRINVTHMIYSLAFVIMFTAPWEWFNAWRQHWVYDINCELYGEKGWFFNKKLHVGIFFQYAWSGFIYMYFSWIVFDRRKPWIKG